MPVIELTIDAGLKTKCPRTALARVTAEVTAGESPAALMEELQAREQEILRLPEPRAVLDAPQIAAARAT